MREVARWCLFGTGALTFGVSTASVFARMREGRISPDLQILFTPGSYDRSRFGELEREPGMTAAVCAVNPESRGTIMAVSPDPKRHPKIRPNYFSAPEDMEVTLAGIRLARRIFAQPAIADVVAAETVPGAEAQDDAALTEFARMHTSTVFHVALDAADGFAAGPALGGASVEVVAGALVAACAGQGDVVEGGVGAAVTAAVEAASAGLAGGRLDRADAAQGGEGGFAAHAVGVVAGGDEQGGGAVGADAVALQQLGRVGVAARR